MRTYSRLEPDAHRRLLADVVVTARQRASTSALPVAVFDLDGTLIDNRPRTVAILRALADGPIPELRVAADRVSADRLEYLLVDTLRSVGVTDAELVAEATEGWKARFFQDPWMVHDVPVPGAPEFVRELHAAGCHVVYLTGRDLPNMSVGTWQSLRALGFPIGLVRTSLVCKPHFDIPDEAYKREIAPSLAELGDVIASFDNEPGNCNAFLEAFPRMASVLLDTQRAPAAPPLLPGVHTIADFVTSVG